MTIDYNTWLKNPIKIFCKCGCNKEVIFNINHVSSYKQYGIPEYIRGHNNRGKKFPPRSEEFKQKLRERIFTEEWKNKLRETKIGKNNPMYGKQLSNAHKKKLSLNHRNISGKNNPMFGEQQRINASNRMKGCVGENAPNWHGGIAYLPYCHKFNNRLKERIRNRDNRTCQECGKTELDNGRKLDVHHIHYDKPNCDPDLISLCRVCNIHANGNRNYWEEHFMKKLKKENYAKQD